MPLDLDAIEAHLRTRRAITLVRWPSDDAYEEARELALMDLANDVPALVARVRAQAAALAEIADTAVGMVRALEVASPDEARLLVRIAEARLRGIQRTAEAELTALTEGGA